MKAVIMAGGIGSRLRPLTCDLPKPMVPIMGKPVMQHGIELLRKHGIKDIAATLMYMPGVIKNYFKDGRDFRINLNYYIEETPLGTAGSVKNAAQFLDQPFIILSGDAVTDLDISEAVRFHKEKGGAVTMVLKREASPLSYGVVLIDSENRICRFVEKPSWSEVTANTVNTGIYIIQPEILDYIPNDRAMDFGKELFSRTAAPRSAHVRLYNRGLLVRYRGFIRVFQRTHGVFIRPPEAGNSSKGLWKRHIH